MFRATAVVCVALLLVGFGFARASLNMTEPGTIKQVHQDLTSEEMRVALNLLGLNRYSYEFCTDRKYHFAIGIDVYYGGKVFDTVDMRLHNRNAGEHRLKLWTLQRENHIEVRYDLDDFQPVRLDDLSTKARRKRHAPCRIELRRDDALGQSVSTLRSHKLVPGAKNLILTLSRDVDPVALGDVLKEVEGLTVAETETIAAKSMVVWLRLDEPSDKQD